MWAELPPGLILVAGAALLPLVPRRLRAWAFLLFPAAAFAHLLSLAPGVSATLPFLGFELVPLEVDRLSLAFGYVFALVAFLGGVYALHLRDTGQQVSTLLYAGSALGVVFAGDLFTLFVFWEIMAVASAWLIWARDEAESYRAAMRYFFVHLAGGSLLMAGILVHLGQTGSIEFVRMEPGVASTLVLLGFALNAAVPPLHAWLADAYPRATVTGAVFLSAFTTKSAVYTLLRGFAGWEILIVAGVVMALYGVVYAVLANDIRGILAYHIISQVGYMVAGAGIGTAAAVNGTTAHAFTHILYKGLLFMGAGAVLYATGRSKLTRLGGLASAMPATLVLYMVGAFSISGFPFFSGFVSKSLTVHAAESAHLYWAFLLLHLASVGTFLHTGLKLPYFTWFGPDRDLDPAPLPKGMFAAMGLAAAVNVALGLNPEVLYSLMPHPVEYEPYTAGHVLETAQILLFTFAGFWILREKLGGEPKIALDTDWLYRRPAGAAHRVFVVAVERVFSAADRGSILAFRALARFSADPAGHLARFGDDPAAGLRGAARLLAGRRPGAEAPLREPTEPTPAEATLGVATLVLVLCVLGVVAAALLGPA